MSSSTKKKGGLFDWLFAKPIDPAMNAKTIEQHTLNFESVCKLATVLATSAGFFWLGYSFSIQHVAQPWAILTGLLAAVFTGWMTDVSFSHFLEKSLFQFFSFWSFRWTKATGKGFYMCQIIPFLSWLVVTGIVSVLFWADWQSIYTTRAPLADQNTEKVTLTNYDELTESQRSRYATLVTPLDSEIKRLNSEIRQAEMATRRGNSNLQKLVDDGNGWAAGQMQTKIRASTSSANSRLQTVQDERTKTIQNVLENQRVETIQRGQLDGQNLSRNDQSRAAIEWIWTLLGFGTKALTVVARLFLILMFLETKGFADVNGDGRVDGDDVTDAAKNGQISNQQSVRQAPPIVVAERRPIGFNQSPESRLTAAIPTDPPLIATPPSPFVNSMSLPVQQLAVEQRQTASDNTTPPTVFAFFGEVEKYQNRARQCHRRTHPSNTKSEKGRADNVTRRDLFLAALSAAGFSFKIYDGETAADYDIDFQQKKSPSQLTTADLQDVAFYLKQIQELKSESTNHLILETA